jgi:hypothetical protein
MEPIKVVMVGEQVAGEAAKTRKQVEKLIQSHILDQFDIGELLWKIKKNNWYSNWGYNTYSEYGKSTGLKDSKLRYLPQISEVMETVGFSKEEYQEVGVAKLRAISSLKPEDTYVNPVTQEETPMVDFIKLLVQKSIDDGEEFTLEQLKKHVRTLKGIVGQKDIAFLGISTQREILDSVMRPALERAKALIGSIGKDDEGNSVDPSDAQAFAYICGDFLATPQEGDEVSTEEVDTVFVEGVGDLTDSQYQNYLDGGQE